MIYAMVLKEYFSKMKKVRAEVSASPVMSDSRPTLGAGLSGFLARIGFAAKLVFTATKAREFKTLISAYHGCQRTLYTRDRICYICI